MTQKLETRLQKLESVIRPNEHIEPLKLNQIIERYCSIRVALPGYTEDPTVKFVDAWGLRVDRMKPSELLKYMGACIREENRDPDVEFSKYCKAWTGTTFQSDLLGQYTVT